MRGGIKLPRPRPRRVFSAGEFWDTLTALDDDALAVTCEETGEVASCVAAEAKTLELQFAMVEAEIRNRRIRRERAEVFTP